MPSARRLLDGLQGRGTDQRDLLLEYALIVGLMVLVVVLAFVLLGDAISDLVSLIGGRVDEAAQGR